MMELKEMDEKQKPRSTSVSCYEQKARCIKASRHQTERERLSVRLYTGRIIKVNLA